MRYLLQDKESMNPYNFSYTGFFRQPSTIIEKRVNFLGRVHYFINIGIQDDN